MVSTNLSLVRDCRPKKISETLSKFDVIFVWLSKVPLQIRNSDQKLENPHEYNQTIFKLWLGIQCYLNVKVSSPYFRHFNERKKIFKSSICHLTKQNYKISYSYVNRAIKLSIMYPYKNFYFKTNISHHECILTTLLFWILCKCHWEFSHVCIYL